MGPQVFTRRPSHFVARDSRLVPLEGAYISAVFSRLPLGCLSAASRLPLGYSAASRLPLGCSRLYLGCVSPAILKPTVLLCRRAHGTRRPASTRPVHSWRCEEAPFTAATRGRGPRALARSAWRLSTSLRHTNTPPVVARGCEHGVLPVRPVGLCLSARPLAD